MNTLWETNFWVLMIWRFKFKFYQNINEGMVINPYAYYLIVSPKLNSDERNPPPRTPSTLTCWASHFFDIYITFVNEGELKVNLTCLSFFVWKSSVLTRSSCFTSQQFAISNLNYLDLQRNFSQPLIQLKFIANWNHMPCIAVFLLMKNCTI